MDVACMEAEGDPPPGFVQHARPLLVRPVGLRLQTLRGDGDELFVDGLASGLAQQVLDHPLAVVVVALAEVVVPDPALRVCEVDRRPVPVGECAPDPVVAVERDRVLDPQGLHGLADVVNLVLERELRRMDADDDQASIAILLGPRAYECQRAEPVDACVCPEVNENDLSSQTLRSERGGVQPAGCPFEYGQATLRGQGGRAWVAARAEEAHVPRPPTWASAYASGASCRRLCPVRPS